MGRSPIPMTPCIVGISTIVQKSELKSIRIGWQYFKETYLVELLRVEASNEEEDVFADAGELSLVVARHLADERQKLAVRHKLVHAYKFRDPLEENKNVQKIKSAWITVATLRRLGSRTWPRGGRTGWSCATCTPLAPERTCGGSSRCTPASRRPSPRRPWCPESAPRKTATSVRSWWGCSRWWPASRTTQFRSNCAKEIS